MSNSLSGIKSNKLPAADVMQFLRPEQREKRLHFNNREYSEENSFPVYGELVILVYKLRVYTSF